MAALGGATLANAGSAGLAAVGAAAAGTDFGAAGAVRPLDATAVLLLAGAALALFVDIELYRFVTGQLCVPSYSTDGAAHSYFGTLAKQQERRRIIATL